MLARLRRARFAFRAPPGSRIVAFSDKAYPAGTKHYDADGHWIGWTALGHEHEPGGVIVDLKLPDA